MTLRNHQIKALSLIAALLLCVPFIASAEGAGVFDKILWSIVVAFFGLFLGLAGMLLDVALNEFVIGFGTNFLDSGVGGAVDLLWVAVRDIFNLTFIFGLVFLGFKMILNSDDSNTRRWLVHLILAALLVNFSLYITKFLIDFTNILATQIANAFPTSNALGGTEVSISEKFMSLMGISSLLGIKHGAFPDQVQDGGVYGFIFGTMILFIVMTFVFAAGAFMLIIRYAVLCIYMVLSPLMFLSWVFPQMQSITSKYWRGFLGQAFFAPIYVLMVYFSMVVLSALFNQNASTGDYPEYALGFGAGPDPGNQVLSSFAGTFPPFILSCVFLMAAVVIGNKLSSDGAVATQRLNNYTQKKIQNGMRRGYKATALATTTPLRNVARRSSYQIGSDLERQITEMQSKKGILGAISRTNAIDTASRRGTAAMKNAKMGSNQSYQEATKQQNRIKGDAKIYQDKQNAQQKYNQAVDSKDLGGRREAKREIAAEMRKMSEQKKMELSYEQLTSPALAAALSDADMKMYKESGRFTNEQMKKLSEARDEGTFAEDLEVLNDVNASVQDVGTALENIGKTMSTLSSERKQSLDYDSYLNNPLMAAHLKEKDFEYMGESGKYDAAKIQELRKTQEKGILALADEKYTELGVSDEASNRLKEKQTEANDLRDRLRENVFTSRTTQDAAGLSVAVLTNDNLRGYVAPRMIEEKNRKSNISSADKEAIQKAVNGMTEQQRKAWVRWSNNNTVGSRFEFNDTDTSNQTTGEPSVDQSPIDLSETKPEPKQRSAEEQRRFDEANEKFK